MIRNDLIEKLRDGRYVLVVEKNGIAKGFDRPGVADLLALLNGKPEPLRGAAVADKVVGKAAAALMVLGGVASVDAVTMSAAAKTMLDAYGVENACEKMVDHIENRDRTGWCPMELCCRDSRTPDECRVAIEKKIEEFKNKKQ